MEHISIDLMILDPLTKVAGATRTHIHLIKSEAPYPLGHRCFLRVMLSFKKRKAIPPQLLINNRVGMSHFPPRLYNRDNNFGTFYRGWIYCGSRAAIISLIKPRWYVFFLLVITPFKRDNVRKIYLD